VSAAVICTSKDAHLVIENKPYQHDRSHPMITCQVIAALRDPFDIEAVGVQNDLHSTDQTGESHAELFSSYDPLGA
jgi:hypothetical protein